MLTQNIGDPCDVCAAPLEENYGHPWCYSCERKQRVADGCRCGGSGTCPEYVAPRCPPECPVCDGDSLCPICNPDS